MRADALPAIAGPTIVCLQAGNVNTGAFDPVEEICRAAHEAGAWVHVDGAFGLWAAAAPRARAPGARRRRGRLVGHRRAQVAQRALRQRARLRARPASRCARRWRVTAAYLPHGEMREPAAHTPELSRRARGVEVWAALRSLGRAGLADLIERNCRHAAGFAEGLRAAGYEILNDVVLNQVLVSFGDEDDDPPRHRGASRRTAPAGAGGTVWQGRTAMRISVSAWATTDEDVERSLAAMLRAAAGV